MIKKTVLFCLVISNFTYYESGLFAESTFLRVPLFMSADRDMVMTREVLKVPVTYVGKPWQEAKAILGDEDDRILFKFIDAIKARDYDKAVEAFGSDGVTITDSTHFGELTHKLLFENVKNLTIIGKMQADEGSVYILKMRREDGITYRLTFVGMTEGKRKVAAFKHPVFEIIENSLNEMREEVHDLIEQNSERKVIGLDKADYKSQYSQWLINESAGENLDRKLEKLIDRMIDSGAHTGFTNYSQKLIVDSLKSIKGHNVDDLIEFYVTALREYKYAFCIHPFYVLRSKDDSRLPWVFLVFDMNDGLLITNIYLHDSWRRLMEEEREIFDRIAYERVNAAD